MVQIQWRIYIIFSDLGNEKLYPNYLKYFNTFDKHPLNPTIFIFDNEISNSKKPLGSFMNYAFNKKESQTIQNRLFERKFIFKNRRKFICGD